MPDLSAMQRDYVRLLVREGVNLQPGQRLVITCAADQAWFARLCAAAAYAGGCREVSMNWTDDALTRMKYLRADDAVFDRCDPWRSLFYNAAAEEGAAWLFLESADPENLRGVDPERIRRAQIASGAALKPFRELEKSNGFPWCIGAVPSPAWAKLVFPALGADEAVARLWTEILRAARCTGGDAVRDWRAHSDELHRRVEILNRFDFVSLHYRSGLGTDLTVELPEGHFWAGGRETCTKNGVLFSANVPTEEVFTLPKRDGVNGTVVASKPLSLHGNLIEGLRFTLRGGRITGLHADRGEALLRAATEVDEGAAYFGEVALVPFHSPISDAGILFYSTLFDENAACHFAFGDAYPCIRGAAELGGEELRARGVNSSITHVDFMVGTADLSVTGLTHAGEAVPVLVDGDFAF
jgi:aminopeptidase